MTSTQEVAARDSGARRTWAGLAIAGLSCALVDVAAAYGWMRPHVSIGVLTVVVGVQGLREWQLSRIFRQYLGQIAHEVGNPVSVLQHAVEETQRSGQMTPDHANRIMSASRRLVRVARRLQTALGLPMQPEPVATSAETLAQPARTSRLLIIDDDDDVRAVLQEAAVAHGFEASVAASVADAVAHVEAGHAVDLVLCDLMMPDGGAETWIAWCRQQRPALVDRTIVITGGPTSAAALALADENPNRLLYKPFSMADLRRVAASNPKL